MYFNDFAGLKTYIVQNGLFGEFTPQARQSLLKKGTWKTKDRYGVIYDFKRGPFGYSVDIY